MHESHTIMRYIHETRGTPDHWYPKDPRKRAKVDEYLDWHHNNLRLGAGGFMKAQIAGKVMNITPSELMLENSFKLAKKALG